MCAKHLIVILQGLAHFILIHRRCLIIFRHRICDCEFREIGNYLADLLIYL